MGKQFRGLYFFLRRKELVFYVYKIWFPTSKKCYIGQTCNLKSRLLRHLNSKYLVGNALRKYDDWQISILHTTKDGDVANLLEIEEIRNHNSIKPNGYNQTIGGDSSLGYKHTKEAIEKIRKIHQGSKQSKETKIKRSMALQGNQNAKGKNLGNKNAQGYHHTKEYKQSKSKEMQGFKHSEESKEKHRGEKNPMKNPVTVLKVLHKKCKNRLEKLEKELL